jgi:hypothetical protein
MSAPASPAIRHTTTAAVAAVGLIAAVVSYSHMQQLGYHHGESWRSYLIPISIDGLMAAASMVLLTRRRSGLPASPLAWVALVLGGIASLSANMADAQPNATAILYAGWAPLGFLLAFELLLQQRRAEGSEEAENTQDEAGSAVPIQPAEPAFPIVAPATPEPVVAPVAVRHEPAQPATKPAPARATKPRQTAAATPEDRRAWVRQQRDKGVSVTGADVHKQFPNSPRDGARIVRQVEAELDRELAAVAAGSR